jgi:hypothetical protein
LAFDRTSSDHFKAFLPIVVLLPQWKLESSGSKGVNREPAMCHQDPHLALVVRYVFCQPRFPVELQRKYLHVEVRTSRVARIGWA